MSSYRFTRVSIGFFLLSMALAVGSFVVRNTVHAATDDDTHKAARTAYNDKIAATYNYRYGKDHPFTPSNMTTDNGEFIDPKDFPTAQYCGHCHQAAHQQWRESAHSNSNRVPWYLKNVGLLNEEKGIEFSRHCEGCHDPIAMVAGALTQAGPKKRPYDADGITCSVCHSMQKNDLRGTGSYVLAVPAVLVDETGEPIHRKVSDLEILSHLDRHSAAVMKPFYRTSEFCASCHKAALPHELNDYKWQRAMTPYDEWQNSSFAKQSPLPFYVKPAVSTCETCHMPREALTGKGDPGAKNGQLASHRWLGANSLIPAYYGYEEQAKRVREFLANSVFNVDIFSLERDGENGQPNRIIAPLGTVSYAVAPGEKLTVTVVIQNKGAAHSHVPEQRDMYESWTAFTVKDSNGKLIGQSGNLQPSGDLDPAAHSFTNRLINKEGTLNGQHEVWNNRVVAYNNTIQSGRSQLVRYSFTIPKDCTGSITITAAVRYRRFDQQFINFALKSNYQQPVLDMVTATRTINIGKTLPSTPDAAENPVWMRWNNYGIGLLDAQQYAASVSAFEQVAKLRPDYADAYTNVAIADIQWERYAEALPSLNKALALSPDNARALYYLALIQRNEGQVDEAIVNLRKVAQQFPRSRDAHRELGFSLYQKQRYAEARTEYEAVQSIDPDDLAAHYNLSIIYRRLGLKEAANRQAAYFADQKDDPTASTFALEYLRKHGDIAQESVPWHTHDLDAHGKASAGELTTSMLPSQQQP
ncbi:tetratricopeptide repeat protein [Terriglobus roseus]|uniref:Tetratricopeptide repeat-containing protein n=1 Tax=Terriglobus roseus TaxID=392734 RepID=A0A1G7GMD5_9BACT|nr:tetratricopeptide repeat protein [Terriglobus roseus]SDE89305.1 Tetratricopeptide repeat-containing protein [Terriglobus roseus]